MAIEMEATTRSENQEQPLSESSPTWTETIGEVTAKAPALRAEIQKVRESLSPAPRDILAKALTSALILCVPAGFDENDRVAWLKAASAALKNIPLDLLKRGIEAVRLTADHPSKIIPGIMAEVEAGWKIRKARLSDLQAMATPQLPPPSDDNIEPCRPEDAAAIMAEFGLKRDPVEQCRRHLGEPRKPTREDYLAMGVPPEALDPKPVEPDPLPAEEAPAEA